MLSKGDLEGIDLRFARPGTNFGKLWTASTVSFLGDGVTLAAGPLLAASVTRDPILVAGVAVAQQLPWLLFSLPGGALVDRLDRRRVMWISDAVRCAAIGFLGGAVLLDLASLPILYAAFFVLGAATVPFSAASTSILPSVVTREGLAGANGRLFGAQVVAGQMVGPPLGGLLFASSTSLPFLVDAGSFVAASALVLAMDGTFRATGLQEAPRTTLRAEISEGFAWLWGHRLLRTLAMALGVMNLTSAATIAVLVLFAGGRLGLGSVGYGLLLSSLAVGGVLGALCAGRVVGWLGAGTTMRGGLLVEASTSAVIALSHNTYVVGTMLALFGFHAIVWNVVTISLRQELVPDGLLGRVNSSYRLLGMGGAAVGALLGGLLAKGFGLTAPFWFAAASVAVMTVVAWRTLGNGTVTAAQENANTP
ncbi:MAG: MFS transporter [Actinomycetota bacterium]|nr:MFS transporter [Actinomycetota bacterium]MDQ3430334.1 MFS transporter [Actinomycetota bacterium]